MHCFLIAQGSVWWLRVLIHSQLSLSQLRTELTSERTQPTHRNLSWKYSVPSATLLICKLDRRESDRRLHSILMNSSLGHQQNLTCPSSLSLKYSVCKLPFLFRLLVTVLPCLLCPYSAVRVVFKITVAASLLILQKVPEVMSSSTTRTTWNFCFKIQRANKKIFWKQQCCLKLGQSGFYGYS